jgi:ribosomal-protein-alanine N-acetyltransferase
MTVTTIVSYERQFRQDILSLLFYSHRTHTHLDWYQTGQWLDMPHNAIQLAYDKDKLVAVLGISAPLNHASWLRFALVAQGYDAAILFNSLWQSLQVWLHAQQVRLVSVLVINTWLNAYLPAMGFHFVEDVVTLHRIDSDMPSLPSHSLQLRNGYVEDIRSIVAVDHAAFAPPWQMSALDIRNSQRLAASCTVALYNGKIIGYEISTRHHTSGHLARLAVRPEMQGQKVGSVLLHNLLTKFSRRGVRSMTVNTQQSNLRSQRLYTRYGFRRNGFDLPIWEYAVK